MWWCGQAACQKGLKGVSRESTTTTTTHRRLGATTVAFGENLGWFSCYETTLPSSMDAISTMGLLASYFLQQHNATTTHGEQTDTENRINQSRLPAYT